LNLLQEKTRNKQEPRNAKYYTARKRGPEIAGLLWRSPSRKLFSSWRIYLASWHRGNHGCL